MERSDENSISPMTDASSIRGSPMEGVQYPALLDANRRTLQGIENQVIGGSRSAQVIGKRPSQETELIISKSCGHRPMTRQFSATLGSQRQLSSIYLPIERQQKRAAITVAENPVDDDSSCTAPMEVIAPLLMADVEMGEISKSEAIDVEMEDAKDDLEEEDEDDDDDDDDNEEEEEEEEEEKEIFPDIDIPDLKHHLAVVEYVKEIHDFYRISEDLSCVDPNYMSNQSDINERMRGILIDWLIKVHHIFELREETLFLTVNLIDRFLALHVVTRKRLQLVGVTALLLACKYEDVTVPFVGDLIFVCDGAYTRTDLLQMERLMLNTLKFNMSVPTPYVFMKRFLKAAQCYKKLEFLSFFMVELCLVDYNMLQFRPSLLAAAAVFTAQCTLNGFQSWSKCSELHSRYTQEELMECSRIMVQMHHEAADGKLTGVHTKFSTRKFRYASKCRPALFLIHHVPMETEPTSDSEVLNQTSSLSLQIGDFLCVSGHLNQTQ